MLSISAQDENTVLFRCDEEGRELLLHRLQEVAAGDHAWFAGEELEHEKYEWVSIESRGVQKLRVQELEHGGKLTLSIECPTKEAVDFLAELRATSGDTVEHTLC